MDLNSFFISTTTQRDKDIMLKEKVLTLSKQEWKKFDKELAYPKPASKALKELMNMKGFDA